MEGFKKYPLIALPLNDENIKENIKSAKNKGIDIIELRIDLFKNTETNNIENIFKFVKENGFGIIATVRSVEEGGGIFIPDDKRIEIFKKVSKYSDILDIELRSTSLHEQISEISRTSGSKLLVSYHDFEKTPNEEEIQNIIDKSKFGDIVKFAFMVNSYDDVGKILSVCHRNREKNIIAIGMGELGKITRVAGFFFGSLITYTYIGESVAPGQIEVEELIKELKFYGLRS
ncbi:type I 3-dehydroquinate dehydratase [Persephonella sp.]